MRDIIAILNTFDLSPVNTILLVALAFFVKGAIKGIFNRVSKSERKNRKQDWAIRRIEQHLELDPIKYPDDNEDY